MALPDFTPDIGILYLIPYDWKRYAVTGALAGFDYDYVYRVTGRAGYETAHAQVCIWQLETNTLPRIARKQLESRGFQVIDIIPEYEGPYYIRFALPYADDSDMPWEHYHPRPAGMPVYPWDAPKMPSPNEHDVVAGPLGIAPITEPEDIPAALEATGLIPVPGVPGLDAPYHTYMADVDAPSAKALEDAPALPCDEPEPPPAAPALTLRYGQRILPVDAIITGPMGGVYARVNISTTARPMWHHVQYLQGTVVTSRAKAA